MTDKATHSFLSSTLIVVPQRLSVCAQFFIDGAIVLGDFCGRRKDRVLCRCVLLRKSYARNYRSRYLNSFSILTHLSFVVYRVVTVVFWDGDDHYHLSLPPSCTDLGSQEKSRFTRVWKEAFDVVEDLRRVFSQTVLEHLETW